MTTAPQLAASMDESWWNWGLRLRPFSQFAGHFCEIRAHARESRRFMIAGYTIITR